MEEIAAVRDEDIDFSDIPELDESFWRNAERIECAATGKVFFTAEISEDGRFRRPGETDPAP